MRDEKAEFFAALDQLTRATTGNTSRKGNCQVNGAFASLRKLGIPDEAVGKYLLQFQRLNDPAFYSYLTFHDTQKYIDELKEHLWRRFRQGMST